jgi:hypothetical protein
MATTTHAGKNKGTTHPSQAGTSEVAIFSRVLEPDRATLSIAAAKAILALDFSQADSDRMRQLLAKAKDGTLSRAEEAEIDNYERVGHILSLMKSKARCSLKSRSAANYKAKTR